jgi:type III restriction enzyme
MKPFYEQPILNSPYFAPTRHHALAEDGTPLEHPPVEGRRKSRYMVPVPKGRRQASKAEQAEFGFGEQLEQGRYSDNAIVNEIRGYVESWRSLPNPSDWGVTPATQRLLLHWRHYNYSGPRPFFCQVEAVETVIWLSEVPV